MTISSEPYFLPGPLFGPAQTVRARPEAKVTDTFTTSPSEEEVLDLVPPKWAGKKTAEIRTRLYYDSQADALAQATYYAGFRPAESGASANFRQLSQLVQKTHTTRLLYHPEKYVYPWVDRRPDGQIQGIYSPSPARQSALDRAASQLLSFAPLAPETVAAHLSLTQTAGALNCEHVVCQSWFNSQEPMRGDLHHLFACDSRGNSFRGNRPFHQAEGDRAEVTTSFGTRTAAGKGFEPLTGKGAAARATLYFLLRYPGQATAYRAQDLDLLLKWHRTDPVSLHEKHRNQAIQQLQGNRNPLIDHPDWAELLDFRLGLCGRTFGPIRNNIECNE